MKTHKVAKAKKTYKIIVQAAALNEWTYEVDATSQEKAESIIRKAIDDGEELPDPVDFEQGKEVDGDLFIADSYEK